MTKLSDIKINPKQTKDEIIASQAEMIHMLRESVAINKNYCEQRNRENWDVRKENASLKIQLQEKDEIIASLTKTIAKLWGAE